jgi:DtxR family transcriptional regulator, Mn-dependent transcriptional regulator
MNAELSRSERELLKAIYRHTREAHEAQTSALAATLQVSPGTVTGSVKRLADRGLVDHTPYRGVRFTDDGRRAAVAAIRRHRIVERFLADMLGYAWNEADRLAASFEHDLPDEVEERLYVALNRPAACPHGFPIPDRSQDDLPRMPTLYALGPGAVVEVALPGSTDDDVVAFLETLGVRPGVTVEVREKHPFDGPIVVAVEGVDRTIGEKLARQIYVTPGAASAAPDPSTRGNGAAQQREAHQ